MENLWAPWRMEYLMSDKKGKNTPHDSTNSINENPIYNCVFCVDKPQDMTRTELAQHPEIQNKILKNTEQEKAYTRALYELSDEDRKRLIVYKGIELYIMLNRYPYASGHLMIMPYRHIADITELTPTESIEMMELTKISCEVLREECKAQGINIGANLGAAAGAGIAEHLHFHLVPRWQGDSQFIAVLAEVRLIPEYLESTQARFELAFKKKVVYKI